MKTFSQYKAFSDKVIGRRSKIIGMWFVLGTSPSYFSIKTIKVHIRIYISMLLNKKI